MPYKNRDEFHACQARYRRRNSEKERARHAKYKREHPEKRRAENAKYRAKYPEKERARITNYQKANPQRFLANCQKRRATKLRAPGRGITPEERLEVLAGSLGLCAYCNQRKTLSLDHIDPLRAGGEHDVDNSAASCRQCNASKHANSLLVWLAKKAAQRRAA